MILVLVTIICGIGEAAQVEYFNVMDYGAKGDAITDDSVVMLSYSLVHEKLILNPLYIRFFQLNITFELSILCQFDSYIVFYLNN